MSERVPAVVGEVLWYVGEVVGEVWWYVGEVVGELCGMSEKLSERFCFGGGGAGRGQISLVFCVLLMFSLFFNQ